MMLGRLYRVLAPFLCSDGGATQAHQRAIKKGSRAYGKEEVFFFFPCLKELTHL